MSRLLSNRNARYQLCLRSDDPSVLPSPVLADSLNSTCGPYFFVCLITTCLYTTLGMASDPTSLHFDVLLMVRSFLKEFERISPMKDI